MRRKNSTTSSSERPERVGEICVSATTPMRIGEPIRVRYSAIGSFRVHTPLLTSPLPADVQRDAPVSFTSVSLTFGGLSGVLS